jgi:hypothetical protein
MNRILLALVVSVPLLAACVAYQPRPQSGLATRDEKGNKVICQMERPLGSNIAEMVCRTQESKDAEAQAAQDAMHANTKSGASPRGN